MWQPVTRREVRQALDEVVNLSHSRGAAQALPPLGTVYLEDITSDNGSTTASDGDEADVAMMFAESAVPGEGAATLEDSMVGVLTGLLNDPLVFSSIQSALERDVNFQRLLAGGEGPALDGAAFARRLALEGPPAASSAGVEVTLTSVLEALAAGISEAASRVGEAFAGIAQMLRGLGDAIRVALNPDGPNPATHGAPSAARRRDPRVMLAVSKLALAMAVFIMFRRVSPGLLLRI